MDYFKHSQQMLMRISETPTTGATSIYQKFFLLSLSHAHEIWKYYDIKINIRARSLVYGELM
jgi:hypothetical protein